MSPLIRGASVEIIREDGSLVFEKQAKRMARARSAVEREQSMDPSNTPGTTPQSDPADTLVTVADALGCDPTDADGMKAAIDALVEASSSAPIHASAARDYPTASAIARGRRMLGGSR